MCEVVFVLGRGAVADGAVEPGGLFIRVFRIDSGVRPTHWVYCNSIHISTAPGEHFLRKARMPLQSNGSSDLIAGELDRISRRNRWDTRLSQDCPQGN